VASGSNKCETCSDLDGKVFAADSDDLPELPLHPNCECELVEYSGPRETDFD
jgi:hypothetical protein